MAGHRCSKWSAAVLARTTTPALSPRPAASSAAIGGDGTSGDRDRVCGESQARGQLIAPVALIGRRYNELEQHQLLGAVLKRAAGGQPAGQPFVTVALHGAHDHICRATSS